MFHNSKQINGAFIESMVFHALAFLYFFVGIGFTRTSLYLLYPRGWHFLMFLLMFVSLLQFLTPVKKPDEEDAMSIRDAILIVLIMTSLGVMLSQLF